MPINEVKSVTQRTIAAAYDGRFADPGDMRESDAFYRWVLERLAPRPGSRLLDVACGEGHLVKWARARGLNSLGMDFSGVAAQVAQRVTAAPVITVADGERLPFADAAFDYVTNTGSLEHFLNPAAGVRELCRVLKPAGSVAIFVPNSYYLVDIVWHVWRTGYGVSHRQVVERFATFREWRDFLEENGLQVQRAYKYNFLFPQATSDWAWYRRHPRKWLNLLVAPLVPFNLSYSFLYICSRRP